MPLLGKLSCRLPLAACCLGMAVGGLPDDSARAAFPGDNGRLAFASDRDGADFVGYDIYSMDATPSASAGRLTTDPGIDLDPAWSPDGQKVAFVSTRDGNHEIYVMNANGTGQTRLTTNSSSDDFPSWSPDGQKIAFTAFRDGNEEIYVMNANGTGQTRLTNSSTSDKEPAWSPDGQKIAFASARDGNFEIYAMNANGSSPTRLMTNGAQDTQPNWSPSGQKIAFSTNRDAGNFEVYAINADGTAPTDLSSDGGLDILPAWSPDGQKIAFESVRASSGDDTEIFVMNANGTGQINVTANAKSDDYPDWQTIKPDADGDGLLDSWETDGIDSNNDGTPEVDLPAMGASPDHKDIFLEIDFMPGHALSQPAIDTVIATFASAPVSNPDASTGINLHVDNGPTSVMTSTGVTWGALSDQDTVTHDPVLGTYATGNDYDWSAFDTVKSANFSTDREPAFHYVVSGHRYGDVSNDSSGVSRGIEGSDLIVSLGPASVGEGSGTASQQAGSLMHELGHNLGLHHGGDDDRNYKPNYLSIMNYSFTFGGLPRVNGTRVLDFSRFQIPLSESALSEPSGMSRPAGSPEAAFFSLFACPNDPAPLFQPTQQFLVPVKSGVVDWNCNHALDGTVGVDVNDDGTLTASTSINDWNVLVYDGGAIGSPGGTVTLPATSEEIEKPIDELIRAAEALDGPLFPQPAPPAAASPGAPQAPAAKKCKKGRKKIKGKCRKKRRK